MTREQRLVPAMCLSILGAAALLSVVPVQSGRAADGVCAAVDGATIEWIVPYSAGGGYDLLSRLIEPVLEAETGAEIVVRNMPGAGGVVGARYVSAAAPDGLTLGILNGSGLLLAGLLGGTDAPSLTDDFTLLGRVSRDHEMWVTAPDSDIGSMDDLFARAAERPILVGVTGPGSNSWLSPVVGAELLGFEIEFVAGYDGFRDVLLALRRGEFDIAGGGAQSIMKRMATDGLRPLLQLGESAVADAPELAGVPRLDGPDGLAAKRAAVLGKDPVRTEALATALIETMGAGRVVAAPAGLTPELAACLEDALYAAMTSEAFGEAAAAAGRTIAPMRGSEALAGIEAAAEQAETFVPMLERSMREFRS